MIVSEHQTYNLPGFGLVRIRLFPNALAVFRFLEQYEHVSRLRFIDQLGPIKDILPGAHHTRYEYLMAQLSLISELCQLQGPLPSGLSLGTHRSTFGEIPGQPKPPSNGEILMVLALLGNMGHLPTTFSGERALLKYLRDTAVARRSFRSGLDVVDRDSFDEVLQTFDLYRINYFVALFLLHRYRRPKDGEEITSFCKAVLRSYLSRDESTLDEAVAALWRLYRSVRRLTYLALDSHYAPVPFSLDLASILLNLDGYLSEVFLEGSGFQAALSRLEDVMRDSVYLEPLTLLNHARVSDAVLKRLESSENLRGVSKLWGTLRPERAAEVFGSVGASWRPSRDSVVYLRYQVERHPSALNDPVGWERRARQKVGLRSCRFGADLDARGETLHVAAMLEEGLEPQLRWKTALRVCKQLVDLDLEIHGEAKQSRREDLANGKSIVRLLLSGAFGTESDFRLVSRSSALGCPFFWGYGSTKLSLQVDTYLNRASAAGTMSRDQLNEIAMLRDALRGIDYRGCLVAYAGSTSLLRNGQADAEFDGIAFLLSRGLTTSTLVIVEAKNKAHGHTEAAHALREKLERLDIGQAADIQRLGNKGAYVRLSPPYVFQSPDCPTDGSLEAHSAYRRTESQPAEDDGAQDVCQDGSEGC